MRVRLTVIWIFFVVACGGDPTSEDIGPIADLIGSDLGAKDSAPPVLDSGLPFDPGFAADPGFAVDLGLTLDPGPEPDPGLAPDLGSVPDINSDPDPGPPPDANLPGKPGGAPCDGDDQCESQVCIPSNAGTVCAQWCADSCENGWPCINLEEPPYNGVWVCLQDMLHICRPCINDEDCTKFSGDQSARCVYFGPLFGSFCGADCADNGLCPEGYECTTLLEDDGFTEYQQCTPISGQCECGALAVIDGAKTFCGTDICPGARKCEPEGLTDCDAPVPEEEVCDGVDNDCDGETDEALGALSCGLGVCANEVSACVSAVSQECTPLDLVTDEVCDGLDNDCDGDVDNHLGHLVCGQGLCVHVVAACVDGLSQECVALDVAVPESCDGLDNDCDGATDEELGTTSCGQGVCTNTAQSCLDGAPVACTPLDASATDICDGLDNDCDGATDEELGTSTCGQGVCTNTVQSCLDGAPVACVPLDLNAAESCDGSDNDCDGIVDNGLIAPLADNQQGVCAGTVKQCNGAGGWDESDPASIPGYEAVESLCDELDNDCDGDTDEGCFTPGELISDPGFDALTGNICGVTGLSAGPQSLGGGWYGYIFDTNPGNPWSCTNMCANADHSSGSGSEPAGFAGGPNGAGCVSWLYQCVIVPNFFNTITLSYKLKAYDQYSVMHHNLILTDQCYTEDLPPGNWSPWSDTIILNNFEEPTEWTQYTHDLTEDLAGYKGQTLLIGIGTESSWAASYNGRTWIDDVHMIVE